MSVTCITISSNKNFLVTGSADQKVKIWELDSLKNCGTLAGHSDDLKIVCVTSDDTKIISSDDHKIIIWSTESLSKIHEFDNQNDWILSLRTFEDFIISIYPNTRIEISRLSSKSFDSYLELKPFKLGSVLQKDNLIAYGSSNTVVILGMNETEIVLEGHNCDVFEVCFNSNKQRLVSVLEGQNKNLILWDLQQKQALSYLDGHNNSVYCVDVSSDDNFAISGDRDSRVLYWDLVGMKLVCEFKGHYYSVFSVKFTKNRRFAVSGGEDKRIYVWDVEDQVEHLVLFGHQSTVSKISITHDDQLIVSGGDDEGIRVWNLEEKSQIFYYRNLEESKWWLVSYPEKKSEFYRFLF